MSRGNRWSEPPPPGGPEAPAPEELGPDRESLPDLRRVLGEMLQVVDGEESQATTETGHQHGNRGHQRQATFSQPPPEPQIGPASQLALVDRVTRTAHTVGEEFKQRYAHGQRL